MRPQEGVVKTSARRRVGGRACALDICLQIYTMLAADCIVAGRGVDFFEYRRNTRKPFQSLTPAMFSKLPGTYNHCSLLLHTSIRYSAAKHPLELQSGGVP